jgi:hypothetical protein
MEERGDEHLLFFVGLNHWGRRERRWGRQRKSINTTLLSNGHLSAVVPPLVRQC